MYEACIMSLGLVQQIGPWRDTPSDTFRRRLKADRRIGGGTFMGGTVAPRSRVVMTPSALGSLPTPLGILDPSKYAKNTIILPPIKRGTRHKPHTGRNGLSRISSMLRPQDNFEVNPHEQTDKIDTRLNYRNKRPSIVSSQYQDTFPTNDNNSEYNLDRADDAYLRATDSLYNQSRLQEFGPDEQEAERAYNAVGSLVPEMAEVTMSKAESDAMSGIYYPANEMTPNPNGSFGLENRANKIINSYNPFTRKGQKPSGRVPLNGPNVPQRTDSEIRKKYAEMDIIANPEQILSANVPITSQQETYEFPHASGVNGNVVGARFVSANRNDDPREIPMDKVPAVTPPIIRKSKSKTNINNVPKSTLNKVTENAIAFDANKPISLKQKGRSKSNSDISMPTASSASYTYPKKKFADKSNILKQNGNETISRQEAIKERSSVVNRVNNWNTKQNTHRQRQENKGRGL